MGLPDVGAEILVLTVFTPCPMGRRFGDFLFFDRSPDLIDGVEHLLALGVADFYFEEFGIGDAVYEAATNSEFEAIFSQQGVSHKLHVLVFAKIITSKFVVDNNGFGTVDYEQIGLAEQAERVAFEKLTCEAFSAIESIFRKLTAEFEGLIPLLRLLALAHFESRLADSGHHVLVENNARTIEPLFNVVDLDPIGSRGG